MFRTTLSAFVFVALFTLTLTPATHAATYTTNTIEPFNQTLGTLTSVTVSVDPPPVSTTPDTAGPFNAPGNHNHQYPSTSFVLPFTTLTFSGGFTSTDGSNIPGSTHVHTIDRAPEVQTYTSGVAFNWFNNPSNPVIGSVNLSAFPVFAGNEDHAHEGRPQSVTPRTIFVYDVPEPALGAAMFSAAALLARRRSDAA